MLNCDIPVIRDCSQHLPLLHPQNLLRIPEDVVQGLNSQSKYLLLSGTTDSAWRKRNILINEKENVYVLLGN